MCMDLYGFCMLPYEWGYLSNYITGGVQRVPWNPPFERASLTRDTLIEQSNCDTLIEQSQ